MADTKKRPDTPLATTPITLLDDLQKVSNERLRLKREERAKQKTDRKALKSGGRTLQGLASLKNTLGQTRKNR